MDNSRGIVRALPGEKDETARAPPCGWDVAGCLPSFVSEERELFAFCRKLAVAASEPFEKRQIREKIINTESNYNIA
jgi:hypothetical protein